MRDCPKYRMGDRVFYDRDEWTVVGKVIYQGPGWLVLRRDHGGDNGCTHAEVHESKVTLLASAPASAGHVAAVGYTVNHLRGVSSGADAALLERALGKARDAAEPRNPGPSIHRRTPEEANAHLAIQLVAAHDALKACVAAMSSVSNYHVPSRDTMRQLGDAIHAAMQALRNKVPQ